MRDLDYYEAAVLSLTMRSDYAAQVFAKVRPEDFSSDMREYASAAKELMDANRAVDAVTVVELLESKGVVNAGEMIGEIADWVSHVSIENLDDYAEIVSKRGLSRALSNANLRASQILQDERDPEAAQTKILELYETLTRTGAADQSLWDMRRASEQFLLEMERRNDAGGELIGLSTGWKHLDERINGLREGDFVVVAGRPSMGKTTFAMNMVEYNAARKQLPCLVFSMEMSAPQIIEKMTASLGGISLTSLRRGTLDTEEWSKFSAAAQMVQGANLHIDDRGGLSVAQMRARAHEVRRKTGDLSLIMVDYIQLMQAPGAENRTNEITKISGGLKALAKEFRCPVVALSQLNRSVELRQDKRPVMSDLRESGAIEQDADIIIFPFRAGYYEDPDNPDPLTEIIFGKIRMGERGTEGLEFQGQYSRFKTLNARVDFAAIQAAKAQADARPKRRKGGMDL